MALTAILSVGSKLLGGGSKLARTANVGRKLLGIKGKKNKETRVEDNEPSAIIVRPSTSLIPESVSVSGSQSTTEPQSTPVSGKSTLEEDVEYIKNKTLEIDKLLKSSFAQRRKEAAKLRKSRENARRSKKEEGYEKGGSSGILGKAKEKVKAPFRNDKFEFDMYDNLKSQIDPENFVKVLTKGIKAASLIECVGLWFAGGKYGCSWKIKQLKVEPSSQISGYSFVDDSDADDEAENADATRAPDNDSEVDDSEVEEDM